MTSAELALAEGPTSSSLARPSREPMGDALIDSSPRLPELPASPGCELDGASSSAQERDAPVEPTVSGSTGARVPRAGRGGAVGEAPRAAAERRAPVSAPGSSEGVAAGSSSVAAGAAKGGAAAPGRGAAKAPLRAAAGRGAAASPRPRSSAASRVAAAASAAAGAPAESDDYGEESGRAVSQTSRAAGRAAGRAVAARARAALGRALAAAGSSLRALAAAAAASLPAAPAAIAVAIPVVACLALMLATSADAGAARGTGALEGNAAEVAAILQREGVANPVAVAAILGNMQQESGLDPSCAQQGGGPGRGLLQWELQGRFQSLVSFAEARGKAWDDLETQVLFMLEEAPGMFSVYGSGASYGTYGTGAKWGLSPSEAMTWRQWQALDDLAWAVESFERVFARGSVPAMDARISYAESFYEQLSAGGSGELAHPCPGAVLTSPFGWREFDGSFHKGWDLAAAEGTPYHAAESGTVISSTNGGGWNGGAGNWVVVDHGGGLVTKYMHSSSTCVSAGEEVTRGQVIGYVGNTGNSFGAHLHFQVEMNGAAVDPAGYVEIR